LECSGRGGNVGPVTSAFTSSVLTLERDPAGFAVLWLDRPDARNAMGRAFWADLPGAMAAVADDPDVRALVMAARGPHFSVGLDLKELAGTLLGGGAGADRTAERASDDDDEDDDGTSASGAPSPAASARATRQFIVAMQAAVSAVADCPKPVIAAVHGYCIGGGMDLATACDLRLATGDAVFSVRETRVAMVADLGSLQRLPRIVGAGHAAELALTGRDVDAERACTMGLVNTVFPSTDALHEGARALAAEIAALSPLAVQGTKSVLAANDGRTVQQGLDYVATWNAGMLMSNDLTEAVVAFMAKRSPRFTGT
jgi:enoyl-CoA hydratase/carnithine racemase